MKLTYRHILFFLHALGCFHGSNAQNLLANPSFEEVNICTEYHAPCNPSAWVSVSPEHLRIDYLYASSAVEGSQIVKLMYHGHGGMRNYAQSMLLCPVVAGKQYRIYIVAGSDHRDTVEVGVRLDTTWIYRLSAVPLDTLPPTIVLKGTDVLPKQKKDEAFSRMERIFTAPANATHVIVGNFNKTKRGEFGNEYLYMDSVSIEPLEKGPLCEEAKAARDKLYAWHDRHTVPRKYYPEEKKVEVRTYREKRHCITVTIKDESIFTPKGRSKYPQTAARMDSIIRVYDPYAGTKVIVTGYAFRPGTANYNKILSTVQAQKLKDVLVYRHGFSVDDVEVYGRGNMEPRYDTTTEAGKEENNFVEIEFCLPKPPPEAIAPPPPAPDTLVIPDVLFRFNSSELNTKLYGALDSLTDRIPRNDTIQLQILGYTDNVGTEAYNLNLSRQRAAAVAQYLKDKGLERYIRHVSGHGETSPVAPNDSEEGRRRNRRVEIIIYKGSE